MLFPEEAYLSKTKIHVSKTNVVNAQLPIPQTSENMAREQRGGQNRKRDAESIPEKYTTGEQYNRFVQ